MIHASTARALLTNPTDPKLLAQAEEDFEVYKTMLNNSERILLTLGDVKYHQPLMASTYTEKSISSLQVLRDFVPKIEEVSKDQNPNEAMQKILLFQEELQSFKKEKNGENFRNAHELGERIWEFCQEKISDQTQEAIKQALITCVGEMKKVDLSGNTVEERILLDYLRRHEILLPAEALLRQVYPDVDLEHSPDTIISYAVDTNKRYKQKSPNQDIWNILNNYGNSHLRPDSLIRNIQNERETIEVAHPQIMKHLSKCDRSQSVFSCTIQGVASQRNIPSYLAPLRVSGYNIREITHNGIGAERWNTVSSSPEARIYTYTIKQTLTPFIEIPDTPDKNTINSYSS